jgi:uncharacterized protein (TIGR03083 family)
VNDPRHLHHLENADFSTYLHSLTDEEWDKPSLCDGWLVRHVVGHILYGNELKLWTLPLRLARFGFSSDRSGRHYSIRRGERGSPQDLLHDFDTRNPWAGTCRVFPPRLVLLDRLVHQQDIRRALGHPRTIPESRLRAVLDATPTLGSAFRARKRTRGLRFAATDLDWSWGTGPEVHGPGEALLMSMLGRKHAVIGLSGPGVGTFSSRV